MALAMVGTPQVTTANGVAAMSLNIPSGGGISGNILVALVGTYPSAPTVPSGLTQFGTTLTGTSGLIYAVMYRICTGSDPASYSWGTPQFGMATLFAASGADTTTPLENATWGAAPSSGTVTFPSTSVSLSNSWWVKWSPDGNDSDTQNTAPAGTQIAYLSGGSTAVSTSAYYATTNPSSTGTDTIVWSANPTDKALSIIVRPSSGGGGGNTASIAWVT